MDHCYANVSTQTTTCCQPLQPLHNVWLLSGHALLLHIRKKSRNLVFFCLKIGKKEILYRFLYKLVLRPKPLTLKKLKVHVVKIFILYNLCSIILFEIFVVCIEGQKFAVLSSEIPINVTHYQFTCMLCWDQKWEIFLFYD